MVGMGHLSIRKVVMVFSRRVVRVVILLCRRNLDLTSLGLAPIEFCNVDFYIERYCTSLLDMGF